MTIEDYLKGCPLCRTPAERFKKKGVDLCNFAIDCPVCGRFRITEEALVELMQMTRGFELVSGWVRERTLQSRPEAYVCSSGYASKPGGSDEFRIAEIIGSFAPQSPAETLDRALLNLAILSGAVGRAVKLDQDSRGAFFSVDTKQMMYYLTEMEKRGWFTHLEKMTPGEVTLSVEGWGRVAELRKVEEFRRIPMAVSPSSSESSGVAMSEPPPSTSKARPNVFICYAKDDADKARELATRLDRAGVDPWLDERKLVLGDDWEVEIRKAVAGADAFVVCLRPGFQEIGFRHREVRWAVEALEMRPIGAGFIIPFISEPCELPEFCKRLHAGGDLSKPTEFSELVRAIEKHCRVSLSTSASPPAVPLQTRPAVAIGSEEAEILRAAGAASGDLKGVVYRMRANSQTGPWIRTGTGEFLWPDDPVRTGAYIDALDSLVNQGLARHESEILYRLTRDGFKAINA